MSLKAIGGARRIGILAASLVVIAATAVAAAEGGTPSFDCLKASGEVEQLICSDEGLAELDRRLAEAYEAAMTACPTDEVSTLKAFQRGWVKGRNDCWKDEEMRACVESSYRTRIVELQIQFGQLEAATPIGFACTGGDAMPFFAAFYPDTDPPSAVLTFGDDQVIAFAAPSGSGARYAAPNVEFWEHHGEAKVDWFGTALSCTAHGRPQ